jgi:hypothetical protein
MYSGGAGGGIGIEAGRDENGETVVDWRVSKQMGIHGEAHATEIDGGVESMEISKRSSVETYPSG